MRKFLLMSSALFAGGLLNGGANAACIQTPTCSSLGYSSSSSCSGGTKCPWGNYWNCDAINKINSLNSQITNLTNKITEQTNTITNLETQITEIRKEVTTSNCWVGDILYSDMTCNSIYVASKTPIGVVFDRSRKLAIGLGESSSTLEWSPKDFDVPGVENIRDATKVSQDMDGKKNTSTILAYCKTKGKSCPAFEYVNSYKTEGTKAGDWYLPSMGELYTIYGNMSVLNVALGKIAATRLTTLSYYWSSSEHSNSNAWKLNFDHSSMYGDDKNDDNYVRPVLAF